ncbi:PAS/PAC sensor signal transduction histidine kinase [Pseudomonas putida S11]|nr:PAS/PAC sensor signal transduction histidine kinase [Pseudomonas putida S11]
MYKDRQLNQNWHATLIRHLLLLITVCLIGGLVSGYYGWSLAIGLALYLGWTLKQLLRLHDWLRNHQPDEAPPDGYGLWGEVFDSIYHLQRRDQRVRGRLQAVIDRVQESTAALRDAVIMLDSDGNLEWWNRAAETLLGFKTPQDGGQQVTNLVRHPRFKEYFEAGNYLEPLEIPSPINDRMRVQLHITRYGNNEHLMLVRDVTRIHQLEQMRKDFVANVSHELRTPLTVITGYLETLLDNVEDVNPRWSRALQQMSQQGSRMQTLLNDLLLLAKLEATDYPSDNHPVAVDALLCAIKNDAQALSGPRKQRITLEAAPRCAVEGQRVRAAQCLFQPGVQRGQVHPGRGKHPDSLVGRCPGRTPVGAGLGGGHRCQAPATSDRALLPGRLQPCVEYRGHRAGAGDRQACADAPPRQTGDQQRAGAWQYVYLSLRTSTIGQRQGLRSGLLRSPSRARPLPQGPQ